MPCSKPSKSTSKGSSRATLALRRRATLRNDHTVTLSLSVPVTEAARVGSLNVENILKGTRYAVREVFDAQDAAYKESVLPRSVRARIAIEAAAADYWRKYVGLDGAVVGMERFGVSAPAKVLFERLGFTVAHVLEVAEGLFRQLAK